MKRINNYQEYQEKLLQLSTMLDDDIDLDLIDEIEDWERRQGLYVNPDEIMFGGDYNG